ncbi:hypothetical protein lerEdw1_013671 [Lerista edwardsae]|nr:hypothetical protein lerEdw1_013674 [Lerista edwardsae]KAJ6640509.1 hypothetical protein lerEdw1_013671 [Lerista edwardsae]
MSGASLVLCRRGSLAFTWSLTAAAGPIAVRLKLLASPTCTAGTEARGWPLSPCSRGRFKEKQIGNSGAGERLRGFPRAAASASAGLDKMSQGHMLADVVAIIEALREPEICYVLDGILFFYGIILTFLYCRLKVQYRKKSKAVPFPIYEKVEGVYTGLSTREPETYTTLELPKRNIPERPSSKPSEIQTSVVE